MPIEAINKVYSVEKDQVKEHHDHLEELENQSTVDSERLDTEQPFQDYKNINDSLNVAKQIKIINSSPATETALSQQLLIC